MENRLTQEERGFSAAALKTIAIVAMVIDHIAWAFVPWEHPFGMAMHFVGRITGPTMFFFIAEGYRHTHNANRYTLRLGIFAVLSYLPFYYFEFGALPSTESYSPVGVIYTLFLGLVAIRALREVKNRTLGIMAALACVVASSVGDWGIIGVVLIVLFDFFRENRKKGLIIAGILFLVGAGLDLVGGALVGDGRGVVAGIVQMGQLLPLVLLWFYNGHRGRGGAFSKWFFYIIYPVHLLVIGIIKFVILRVPPP